MVDAAMKMFRNANCQLVGHASREGFGVRRRGPFGAHRFTLARDPGNLVLLARSVILPCGDEFEHERNWFYPPRWRPVS